MERHLRLVVEKPFNAASFLHRHQRKRQISVHHIVAMASVQTPLKLPFTSAKLPRNIYCPFAVYYGKGKPAVFLPQVLWPDKSSHHRKMLQDELKSLRTDHNTEQATTHEVSDHASLLTYSLHLPYVLKFGMTGALPPHDMLYYMEAFFGNCMVDRTGVLTRCASVKILDPIPALDPAFRKEFPEICMERAREIHARAAEEGFGVKVLWSGGMDSTTALVALIKSASPRELTNITVLLTKASIAEYRLFYRKFLVSSVRTQLITDLSNVYKMNGDDDGPFLVVTGELGDQIFGSMYMKLCYVPPYRFNRLKKKNVFSGQLFAPWREFMPEMLVHYGAIPPTAAEDWLRWIEPQVARAPIPIVSTYDMLWWINYSLKWQHVSLRIVNAQTKIKANMFKRTEHFFRSDDFQQWSFHNHSDKIADYNDWTTYKVRALKKSHLQSQSSQVAEFLTLCFAFIFLWFSCFAYTVICCHFLRHCCSGCSQRLHLRIHGRRKVPQREGEGAVASAGNEEQFQWI